MYGAHNKRPASQLYGETVKCQGKSRDRDCQLVGGISFPCGSNSRSGT